MNVAPTPNSLEPVPWGRDGATFTGRSVLYWACHGGHADLVEALLARGGVDHDGSAAIAVTTSAEAADDERDLLFDPDVGVYSDFVDYAVPRAREAAAPATAAAGAAAGDDEAARRIRKMLAAAAASREAAARPAEPRPVIFSSAVDEDGGGGAPVGDASRAASALSLIHI